MPAKIMDAGSVLRTITKCRVMEGAGLRNILRMKVMDADSNLQTVAVFATLLSAGISAGVNVEVIATTPQGIPVAWEYTYFVTANPSGGLGPYSYAWEIISGTNWTIGNPSAASTSIVGRTSNSTAGTARVTITDSSGQTATATIPLVLSF